MRRITALILSFLLLVPVYSIQAASSLSYDADRLFFLESLGITEGINKELSSSVTRAEFTAMVVRSVKLEGLNPERTGFDDVSSETPFANEIYVAKALRISNGTADAKFSPDEPIVFDAACKELVIALGYEHKAEYLGSYPTGYARVSSELGFAKGITDSGIFTYSDAINLIYNALHTPVMMQSGVKGDEIVYDTQGTPLTVCFKLKSISGVVSTVNFISDTNLYCAHDIIEISGKTFKCTLDADNFFGKSVTLWYDDKDCAVAIDADSTNKEIVLGMDEIIKFSNSELHTVNDNNKETKYKLDPGFGFIKNGKLISHTTSDFIASSGEARLIDNNSDNLYDYYILDSVEYFVVRSLNPVDRTIYDSKSSLGHVNLNDDELRQVKILKYNKEDNTYTNASFDDIIENSSVEVIQSEDKSVCKIIISDNNELIGEVNEISEEGIIINGESYKLNYYFNEMGCAVSAGESYTFILAPDGTITDIKSLNDDGIHYGFTLGFGKSDGLSALVQMKLLTENNTYEVYNLAENVKLDGVNKKREDSVFETKFKNGQYPVYSLIRYSLNDNGDIKMIDTASSASLNDNLSFSYDINDSLSLYSEKSLLRYRWSGNYAMPNYILNNTMVFTVPKALESSSNENKFYDDECFRRGSITSVRNDAERITNVYDLDDNYYPGAVVIYTNEASTTELITPSISASSMMVLNITSAVDDDGENVKKLYCVSKGKYYEYYLYSSLETQLINADKMPSKGDIVRLSVNGSKITGLAKDVKYVSGGCTINYSVDSLGSSNTAEFSYISGTLITKDTASLVLLADKKPTPSTGSYIHNIAPVSLSAPTYIVYDLKSGEVYPAKENSLQATGERSQYVVCRLDNYVATAVFIYLN